MDSKKVPYFVTYDGSEGCLMVVRAEIAAKLADYIEQEWSANLHFEVIHYQQGFYSLAWQCFERVGIVKVRLQSEEEEIAVSQASRKNAELVRHIRPCDNKMFLGTLATTVAATFFADVVNED